MATTHRLPFEKEIHELEDALAAVEARAGSGAEEVRRMRRDLVGIKKRIYQSLTPWQTILVSRHPEKRPQARGS